jgi:hypothetical protein
VRGVFFNICNRVGKQNLGEVYHAWKQKNDCFANMSSNLLFVKQNEVT